MKNKCQVQAIGTVKIENDIYSIHIDEKFLPALKNIEGFSHLQVVWWGHLTDDSKNRNRFILEKLFRNGPDLIGIFATRSPIRPNPILISTIKIQEIDLDKGRIYTSFIDADNNTPVLDIKPYFLMERVRNCNVPTWCEHWPQWFEDSLALNWRDEIIKPR
jgi:tRNA-Thr(GGU) m(6)t(6)A37 methyltransferase TsaA